MKAYHSASKNIWTGRRSNDTLYLHEKVTCVNFEEMISAPFPEKTIALLGYACDEGVRRNQGRIGAASGPDAIRKALAKMPNHLNNETTLIDVGNITCRDGDMEASQKLLGEAVHQLLMKKGIPILLGGGHDIAYGHFQGIRNSLDPKEVIGILNFDAHFDLRDNENGNNSGTPFFQIAKETIANGQDFHYYCLGIRNDANDRKLFKTAKTFKANYLPNDFFDLQYWETIQVELIGFIEKVHHLYVTIDLDGFSSAYAPGVSAPSPLGFSPAVVLKCLEFIMASDKLIGIDLAEMNPVYDIDDQTAKLAASLAHYIMHRF